MTLMPRNLYAPGAATGIQTLLWTRTGLQTVAQGEGGRKKACIQD